MNINLLRQLNARRAANEPTVLLTRMGDGAQALLDIAGTTLTGADIPLDEPAHDAILKRLRDDRSGVVEMGDTRLFAQTHNPPLRLIIIGAVHIAQALAPMASLAGYAVTVVDPRRAFATDARFPGITVLRDWPDEAVEALKPNHRTAVATLTHDPKLDDPALIAALASPVFYIGALGSRKTHAARRERLTAAGVDSARQDFIRGPIGLAIGAVSPAEIAISVLAQMTAALHGAPDLVAAPPPTRSAA